MDIHPQYTYDHSGNPIGVFLPIDEWQQIANQLEDKTPIWQQQEAIKRLETYKANPNTALEEESFINAIQNATESV